MRQFDIELIDTRFGYSVKFNYISMGFSIWLTEQSSDFYAQAGRTTSRHEEEDCDMEEPDSGRRSPFTSSSNGWFFLELSCPMPPARLPPPLRCG